MRLSNLLIIFIQITMFIPHNTQHLTDDRLGINFLIHKKFNAIIFFIKNLK